MSDHRAMVPYRALSINAAMVEAYMLHEGIKSGEVPDVTWFSPREAAAASVMVRDTGIGRRRNPDGSTTLTCFVEPTKTPSLYAWALAIWADAGVGRASDGG